jgi:hypothetical protein
VTSKEAAERELEAIRADVERARAKFERRDGLTPHDYDVLEREIGIYLGIVDDHTARSLVPDWLRPSTYPCRHCLVKISPEEADDLDGACGACFYGD